MTSRLRDTVLDQIEASARKRVAVETLLAAVRRLPLGPVSDFEIRDRLLAALEALAGEGRLRLPAGRRSWDRQGGLPRFVTALRPEAEAIRQRRRETLDTLRHDTAWEPTRMVAFAHTLKGEAELRRARRVNRYLLERRPDAECIPHRERALAVFGDEKALDGYVRQGLFGGRISLADLDCFYCPEPLPFRPLSMDRARTAGKPLLVVENACTYWSCRRANDTLEIYAAVVYGQGFAVCAAERASDGLQDIEEQVAAAGVLYFGDLDPVGLAIPRRISEYRRQKDLAPLRAERRLYRALLQRGRTVAYRRPQQTAHDPSWARAWLGGELAAIYLDKAHAARWPQEGLSAEAITAAIGNPAMREGDLP
jgi:hypothetical protein